MTTAAPVASSSANVSPPPAVCYNTCNNVYIAALKTGKTPALCAPESEFETGYSACQACVEANSDVDANAGANVYATFAQFIDYCASQVTISGVAGNTTMATISSSGSQSFSSLPSSLPPFTNAVSSLTVSPSGSAYSTVTAINTELVPLFNGSTITLTITNLITLRSQPSIASSSAATVPTETQSEASPDHAQFYGILFGSIFGGLSVIIFSYWIYRRFWRRQLLRRSTDSDTAAGKNDNEKAQLHSDCVPSTSIDPQEMDGSPRGPIAELQAVEPVGAELT
ncbi:hypothetical protein SBOR_7925 [Sclerotinia borealis F-4128]|uniref:Uncharacterized protein n=1 Tax=Sclerotinia borealis (strain F-4128) TaxID=1432307 RepID=W9C7D3_SCLBF|nr:hypothetical protein SBOR_7925 [Sclerotinia borealis F-4128]